MKRRSPCILLATLCCLLAVATSAEAAWVSWTRATTQDGSETWSISAATETAMQCLAGAEAAVNDVVSGTIRDRDQARRYQSIRDSGYTFTRQGPHSLEATRSDGTTLQIEFKCLPDTVDPRGPKGK